MTSNKQNQQIKRTFIIGEEWLYFKIYTGVKTSDVIISNIIFPLAQNLIKQCIVKKWFFIRYSDPKPHIRLRFNINTSRDIYYIINEFHPKIKQLTEQDIIWKFQIDTYNREIERYGNSSIEISEDIFFNDSIMVASLIQQEPDDNIRWLFALKAIDSFLTSFKFLDYQKANLLENLKMNFANEFNISKFQNKQIDKKFRKNRTQIESILASNHAESGQFEELFSIIFERDKNTTTHVEKILILKEENSLEVNFDSFISSHIHMTMNRIFRSKNRLNELICYDFLYRFYKSDIAKRRLNLKNS
jgi:thiopeptide-type bacteriocin biosynthesis protein